jgi:hypothetical protein
MTPGLPWLLGLALGLAPLAARSGEPSAAAEAMRLAREAAAAADAQDLPAYLAKMEAAAALRPDFPRILVNLAAAQLANEQADAALATLGRLAELGLHSPVEKSDEFAALRGRKEFKDVITRLAKNLEPKGEGEIAFTLPGMTGLIEGIAWREKTGDFILATSTIGPSGCARKTRRFAVSPRTTSRSSGSSASWWTKRGVPSGRRPRPCRPCAGTPTNWTVRRDWPSSTS